MAQGSKRCNFVICWHTLALLACRQLLGAFLLIQYAMQQRLAVASTAAYKGACACADMVTLTAAASSRSAAHLDQPVCI
jgi:hypothetical protein